MRVNDQPVPAIASGDRPGPDTPMGRWPADLYVAIESVVYSQPQWDASPDVLWDDTDNLWDEVSGTDVAFTDAICWLQGMDLELGPPGADGRFTAGQVTISLDNRDGRWSRYGPTGQLVFYPPGRLVLIWATLAGEAWWLFAGRVATWREAGQSVELVAFDAFSELNVRLNEWHAGAAGDTPPERMDAIVDLIGWPGPTYLDPGDVTLLDHPTTASPLEELQSVAESDGGVLFVDADGTLTYRDRRWPGGRPDQGAVPTFSGNVCDAPVVVWDLQLATDDDTLTNYVTLGNAAEPPATVTAFDAVSRGRHGTYTLPANRDADLWATAGQGQALAEFIVASRGDPTSRIAAASLYLHDGRHDYWREAIDLRRGDAVELVQDTLTQDGSVRRLNTFLIVAGIRHQVTPSAWVTTFSTSRTVANVLVTRWDESPWTWDDTNPANIWSH